MPCDNYSRVVPPAIRDRDVEGEPDLSGGPATPNGDIAPRDLIVTLFGLYARTTDNWLPVASLVRMMADLDVDGPAVRSSISRLKRRDVLISERHGRVPGYALSPEMVAIVGEGDARIFRRRRARTEDGWVLAVFSVPESEREKRHQLRSSLTKLGFGTAAPGVWIAPGSLAGETRNALVRRGLSAYVELFASTYLAFGDVPTQVRVWWDLDGLSLHYADFIERYRPLAPDPADGRLLNRTAFLRYVPMLTQWRRLPYGDPGLPLELLPQGWNGVTAEELFTTLNSALGAPAREHAMAAIRP